jgi:hypothetical protein
MQTVNELYEKFKEVKDTYTLPYLANYAVNCYTWMLFKYDLVRTIKSIEKDYKTLVHEVFVGQEVFKLIMRLPGFAFIDIRNDEGHLTQGFLSNLEMFGEVEDLKIVSMNEVIVPREALFLTFKGDTPMIPIVEIIFWESQFSPYSVTKMDEENNNKEDHQE